MTGSDDNRLERIERKLDQMSEAVVALARVEERMVTVFKRMSTLDEEHSQHNQRLTVVENKVGNNGQMLRFAERVFWILLAAGVSYMMTKG